MVAYQVMICLLPICKGVLSLFASTNINDHLHHVATNKHVVSLLAGSNLLALKFAQRVERLRPGREARTAQRSSTLSLRRDVCCLATDRTHHVDVRQ